MLAEGELRELVVEVRGVAADELVGLRTFTFFFLFFSKTTLLVIVLHSMVDTRRM